jgi:hypothetical protein
MGAVLVGALVYLLWRAWQAVRSSQYDLPFRSTHVKRCADCNVPITPNNDSGWQVFVMGNMTQACCKTCMAKRDASMVGAITPKERE